MRMDRCLGWLALSIGVVSLGDAEAASPVARIDYEVVREHADHVDRYRVTLHFDGTKDGTTTLKLPGRWASAEHAERGIEDLAVITPGARLEDTGEPDVKRVVHRPGEALTVRYALRQIAPGEPSIENGTPYLPVIRPGWFEWIGWTTWVTPLMEDQLLRITIRFANLPDDWSFASSFGLDPKRVVFEGPMDRFRSAIFVGGDFRLRSRPARGGPVITAVRGDWPMRDGAFADRIHGIVDGERAFWRDDSQPFFLVVLVPLAAPPGTRNSVGTGLTQSFAAFLSRGSPLEDLDFLWTHEYFHNWNNEALGRFAEPQADLYWFSEGFTDYYTELLQLRWGMHTLEQYAAVYDDKVKTLAGSPYVALPNRDIAPRFFSNGAIGQLPYLRGALLAAQWDAEIRRGSDGKRSLDELMRGLHREHRDGAAMLDARRIVARAKAEGVVDPEGDVERRIDRGEMPPFASGTLSACVAFGEATEARFDWGFDLDGSIKGGRITGLNVEGPAYAAGLRETQLLRSANGNKRVDRLVEVGVQDAPKGEIRILRYYPVGAAVTRQTTTLRPGITDAERTACLRSLGVPPASEVPSRFPSTAAP